MSKMHSPYLSLALKCERKRPTCSQTAMWCHRKFKRLAVLCMYSHECRAREIRLRKEREKPARTFKSDIFLVLMSHNTTILFSISQSVRASSKDNERQIQSDNNSISQMWFQFVRQRTSHQNRAHDVRRELYDLWQRRRWLRRGRDLHSRCRGLLLQAVLRSRQECTYAALLHQLLARGRSRDTYQQSHLQHINNLGRHHGHGEADFVKEGQRLGALPPIWQGHTRIYWQGLFAIGLWRRREMHWWPLRRLAESI